MCMLSEPMYWLQQPEHMADAYFKVTWLVEETVMHERQQCPACKACSNVNMCRHWEYQLAGLRILSVEVPDDESAVVVAAVQV